MLAEAKASNYTLFLAQARQRAVNQTGVEVALVAEGESPWGAYGTPMAKIEKNMGRLLGMPFRDFFKERRRINGKVYAMDVMGTGGFKGVDGEVDITLVDFRTKEQKTNDLIRNKVVIPGDVMDDKTWAPINRLFTKNHDPDHPEINQFIANLGDTEFRGFDLVTCRPFGAWGVLKGAALSTDPDALQAEWSVPSRIVSYLNPRGGTALIEMSGAMPYDDWVKELNQTEGIAARHYDKFVMITRTGNQNGDLPKLANF